MMVFRQMLIFLCLMLLGIYARRKGMLDEHNQKQISSLVINIAYPAIILSGVSGDGVRMEGEEKKRFRLRDLMNVGMGACVLSIIIYFSGIRLPYVLNTTIQMVGGLTAPLAMMLIGASLTDIPWKSLITNGRLIAFVLLKMLVFPMLVLLALGQFVHHQVLLAVALCALATPSGNMLAMLAAIYNKDSFLLATEGISLTTAVSVITMPLVTFLAGIG